jgi:flagellar hook-associated protein 1 FlgK
MSGSADLFIIGASGARAYRTAMGAVSENIANASTEGYNRRSVRIIESPTSAATSQYYVPWTAFGGALVDGISRANDMYLDAAARQTSSALGNVDQRARWMSDVEQALNDGDLGVGKRMTSMFSAVERLAANPTDTTLRTNVLFAMEQVATAFEQSHTDLKTILGSIGTEAGNQVTALNDALARLARANDGLRRAIPDTAAQAQLLDSRDQALSDIAKRVDVRTSFVDHGVAEITYNGTPVVAGITAKLFGVTTNADGTLAFTLDGTATTTPASGALAGLAQSASVTAQRITTLNTVANQYVADVNTWHAQGVTAAGNPGGTMLSIGADASTIQVLISDPAQVAAGSSDGRLNGNLLAIDSIRGNGSMEQSWTALVTAHGNLFNATKAEQTSAARQDEQAKAMRDDVSGVDLDREAADLLRLQQAYNASAKVIQVARETADAIINIV